MKYSTLSLDTIDFLAEKHKEGAISGTEIMLILVISKYTWWEEGKQNPCMKSSTSLAKTLGRSEAQIKRSLVRLKKAGIIFFNYRTQVGKKIRTTTKERVALKRQRRERTLRTQYLFDTKNIEINKKKNNKKNIKKNNN